MSDPGQPVPPEDPSEPDELDLVALSEVNNQLMSMHRELAKKEALLREANQSKNQLFAMVAHDLRTPLSTISGFSQTLQQRLRDSLSDQDELLFSRIDAQAQRMLDLVDELLDAAVLERSTSQLELEDVDLHALLEQSVAAQAPAAARKDIEIDLVEPDAPVTASVDRNRMAQVIDNLLSNAIKYTPLDIGATITVACSVDDTAVRIRIDDQGIGIDDQLLRRLFEPLARAGATGTGGEPSTGLGLAITRSIVSAHGGTIDVSSDPGRGSSFEVVLPTTPASH